MPINAVGLPCTFWGKLWSPSRSYSTSHTHYHSSPTIEGQPQLGAQGIKPVDLAYKACIPAVVIKRLFVLVCSVIIDIFVCVGFGLVFFCCLLVSVIFGIQKATNLINAECP